MVRTLLIIAAAGIVLSIVTLGGAAVLAGPELRNGWYFDENGWNTGDTHADYGPRVERELEWTGGDTLTVALPADVVFVQGEDASVRISAPETVADRITLVDGRLDFEGDRDNAWLTFQRGERDVRIVVTAPNVSRFVVNGSGDLDLRALDLTDLSVEIAGSGEIDANGRAETVTATVRGSGDADLRGVTANRATIRIDGSGDVSAHAVQAAAVEINGSGDVNLRGRPGEVTQVINGSGDVRVSSDD